MQKWLENNDDAPSSLKVWGVQKESYSYTDFDEWVLNHGTLDIEKKGKEKEKEKDEVGPSKGKKHKKNKNL